VNAVITAGGTIGGRYASLAGTRIKALARVRGQTMLGRTIEAAYTAGASRVAVVGGAQVASACRSCVDKTVEQSDDGGENVARALRSWPTDEPLLYLTSDMPYVTGAALQSFLALVPFGTFAMSLCSYSIFAQRFPEAPPFGIVLSHERVVNGGAFAIPAGIAPRIATVAATFFAARKSRFAMARLLGPTLTLRYLTGRLSIDALEAYATRVLDVRACAIRHAAPELGFDADLVEEYEYACAHT
jgi:hypothetical protein